ncbi:MAG: phosphoglycerate kinase [Deltaproteobacteria bacterium]|uniref:Phosphoglycerate kinase n=1 Tax=Candidatus Zymogenus saltonus TaxID=2844893 RepID=A0A9D8PNH7_9DELT|nr:phosphoglycerate kinase [Candidatus Zymogenus saltonus]
MTGQSITYIDDIDIKGKTLLVRVDMNVPMDELGNITNDLRIRSVLPTVNYSLDEGCKVILMSHMGRPKGEVVEKLSLKPVAKRLSRLLNKEVIMAPDCVGPEVQKLVKGMKPGDVMLLENLRFHPGETKNDEKFAKELSELADIYINNAFAVAHRAHASVHAITKYFDICVAGFLMKNELNYFDRAVKNPARPVVAILGGAKAADKLGAIENLLDKVDKLIIGGAMAFTFLSAMNYEMGSSPVETDLVWKAKGLMEKANIKGVKLYLPVDAVVAEKFDSRAETKIVPVQEIPEHWHIMDIGPATTTLFGEVLHNAKTIIWNGPMGVFEMDAFSRGTFAMVSNVVKSYALTIVGGGDTDVAVMKAGELANVSYVSTGGGAFIELLEGKKLPAIAALEEKVIRDEREADSG